MMYTNYPTNTFSAVNTAARTVNHTNTYTDANANGYIHPSKRLEHEIATAYVGVDTSGLVLYVEPKGDVAQEEGMALYGQCRIRQTKVFEEMEYLCTKYQKAMWASESVIRELKKLMTDPNPYRANLAANADSFLQHMHQRGLLNIIPCASAGVPNGDHEILMILENLRATATTPLTLLCQDGRLAADAMRKNETACVSGQPIRVYRFNMGGVLCRFEANSSVSTQRPMVQQGWKPLAPVSQPVTPAAAQVSGGFGPSRPAVQATVPTARPITGGFGPARPVSQPVAPVAAQVSGSFGPARPVSQPVAPVAAQVSGFGPSRPVVQADDQRRGYMPAPRNQAVREQRFTPASTEIGAPTSLSYEPRDIAVPGCPVPAKGAKVTTMDGTAYTLGDQFSAGGEATLYRVAEDSGLLVKIYHKAVSHAQAYKIATLAAMEDMHGVVLPTAPVYTEAGRFAGYAMQLVEDAVPLATTFDPAWREEQQANSLFVNSFDWDREEYMRAAVNLVRIVRTLHDNGVTITDASLQNVLVGKDADGKYSANHLMLIDVDSAQVDTAEGVVAGGGVTEDFCPGEIASQLPFSTDMLFSESTLAANLALQTFMTIMIGVHPYARAGNDAGFSRAAARGEFPYSLTGKRSQFDTLENGHTYLFSYLPTKLKELYFNLLHIAGDMFKDNRISLADLQRELEYALRWLGDPATLKRFPEAKSLTPSSCKPFTHACTYPSCTTGMPNEVYRVVPRPEELTEGAVLKLRGQYGQPDQFYCPACYQHMMEQRKRARESAMQSASGQGGWSGSVAMR